MSTITSKRRLASIHSSDAHSSTHHGAGRDTDAGTAAPDAVEQLGCDRSGDVGLDHPHIARPRAAARGTSAPARGNSNVCTRVATPYPKRG